MTAAARVDLTDLDLWARGVPYGEFARLRAEEPVAWFEEPTPNSGFWSVHRYADIMTASRDTATFSSSRGVSFEEPTDEDLSWAAFTVLFVLWIWGEQQTRHLAVEAGVTKGTLTGVLKTLEKRGLTKRQAHDEDGRLVLVSLEPKGEAVIERLFPAFNASETQVSSALSDWEKNQLAGLLRKIVRSVEAG